jgi:CubicO group peptidase (beta-lactamase class C family)
MSTPGLFRRRRSSLRILARSLAVTDQHLVARPVGGIAGVPGSAGEFMWAGYAGTYFWVDPKEDLTAVYMSQAPSQIRAYYRKLVKQLVYGALTD